jgi:hypothetical protein
MAFNLDGYNTVAERIAEFREKHPEGSLRAADPCNAWSLVEVGGKTFIAYTALAYRTADDPAPGVGVAWEPVPGSTPYTRDSELMNAETAAWGRAIVAVLAADSSKGIATAEEVRNRKESGTAPSTAPGGVPANSPTTTTPSGGGGASPLSPNREATLVAAQRVLGFGRDKSDEQIITDAVERGYSDESYDKKTYYLANKLAESAGREGEKRVVSKFHKALKDCVSQVRLAEIAAEVQA